MLLEQKVLVISLPYFLKSTWQIFSSKDVVSENAANDHKMESKAISKSGLLDGVQLIWAIAALSRYQGFLWLASESTVQELLRAFSITANKRSAELSPKEYEELHEFSVGFLGNAAPLGGNLYYAAQRTLRD